MTVQPLGGTAQTYTGYTFVVAQDSSLSRTEILTRVNGVARQRFHIDHTTIQIEEPNVTQEVFESCNCHFGAWDSSS